MNAPQPLSWMWAEACTLLEQADRRQKRFMERLGGATDRPAWQAPADVLVAGEALHIIVALPGADADQVVISLVDGALQIEAQVPPPDFGPGSRMLRLEIPHGVLRRRIALPPGRYRLTERRLARGCLHLRLEEANP